MPVLVDGDNLLGTWPGRSRSDAEKRDLARTLARLAREEGRRIIVVFDGADTPVLPGGPDILHAGAGRRADDVILERLRRETDRRGWTVVTNDRSLADQCRWLEARLERCERFRRRLQGREEGGKPTGETEVDYWLGVFRDPDEPAP